jgi:hypothetical protein
MKDSFIKFGGQQSAVTIACCLLIAGCQPQAV